MPPLPFAVRFFGLVIIVLLLHLLAIVGLVLLGLMGAALLTDPLVVVGVLVAAGVVIGLVIGLFLLLWLGGGPEASLLIVVALLLFGVAAAAVPLLFFPVTAPLAMVTISLLGLLATFLLLLWFIFGVHRLPLRLLGLPRLSNLPGIPFRLADLAQTVPGLLGKAQEIQPAKDALITRFTLGAGTPEEETALGKTFIYGEGESRSLDEPEQFAMGWTTFDNIAARAAPLLPGWAASLTTAVSTGGSLVATDLFWPMLAKFAIPFNIVPLQKVTAALSARFEVEFGTEWTAPTGGASLKLLAQQGRLYCIDMMLFKSVAPPTTAAPRFTPATITFLIFDAAARTFTPLLIRVFNGARFADYTPAVPSTWLYALQAAKTSITVWGIWIGHVHHWHLVVTAMQMSMYARLSRNHVVRQMLGYQSEWMIGFDEVLFLDWAFGPPTSVDSTDKFLRLVDRYCVGRQYFDDDPDAALAAQGLDVSQFTSLPPGDPNRIPWDLFPVARYQLAIWAATTTYVTSVVNAVYPNDPSVGLDARLQAWLAGARNSAWGNIQGIPAVLTRATLIKVVTSVIARITQHGMFRLGPTANPVLSFVGNFPPCLEDSRIPDPTTPLTTKQLLEFMPKTGTIGEMLSFLYVFCFSTVYKSFIPVEGILTDLPYRGLGPSTDDACNAALIQYRRDIEEFIKMFLDDSNRQRMPARMDYQSTPQQIHQWELSTEI